MLNGIQKSAEISSSVSSIGFLLDSELRPGDKARHLLIIGIHDLDVDDVFALFSQTRTQIRERCCITKSVELRTSHFWALQRYREQKHSRLRKIVLTGGISLGSATVWSNDCSPAFRGQDLSIVADSVQKSSSFVNSLITPSLKEKGQKKDRRQWLVSEFESYQHCMHDSIAMLHQKKEWGELLPSWRLFGRFCKFPFDHAINSFFLARPWAAAIHGFDVFCSVQTR